VGVNLLFTHWDKEEEEEEEEEEGVRKADLRWF
jgi:hypothetical protein